MKCRRLAVTVALVLTATVVTQPTETAAAGVVTTPVEVADINTTASGGGTAGSDPRSYVALDDLILFVADDGVHGVELWVLDTTTDTTTVIDIVTGPSGSEPFYLEPTGSHVFFSADDGTGDRELWKTDGTSAGTARVENIDPSGSSRPWGMTALGDLVVFQADDGTNGREPWVSDGTSSGTVRLADINPTGSSDLDGLIAFDNNIYFSAYDGADRPLWKTDGTTAGTEQVTAPGAPARASDLGVFDDMLLFSGDRRLWKTDGTTAGTEMVHTAVAGEEEDRPTHITASGDHAFFWARVGLGSDALWVTDGTSAGTRWLTDQVGVSNDPIGSLENGSVVFAAHTDDDGEEPWISDGTVAGTTMLADLVTGSDDSDPRGMSAHNGFVFFGATTPALGEELYVTDGTTVDLVDDFNTGTPDGVDGGRFEDEYDEPILSTGAQLYFTATSADHGAEPWVLDAYDVFVSVDPGRFADTRPLGDTIDGQYEADGANPAGTSYEVQIAGRGQVPADATAAIINLTTVLADAPGHATVYPCTATVPNSSAANYLPGGVDPNEVIAKLSPDGKICIYTHATVHLLVDVVGYTTPASPYMAIEPTRYADSRPQDTFDNQYRDTGKIDGGTFWKIPIAGRGPIPASATTAVLNITAVVPDAAGHITVYPCTTTVPTASSLNYTAGMVRPNEVVAKLSATGHVCVYTHATSHLIVDAVGYIDDVPGYTSIDPTRYADSRPQATFDGNYRDRGPNPAGTSWEIPIAGRGSIPTDATSATLNVTVVLPDTFGHATVYPCTATVPNASSLNYNAGDVRANEVIAKLSPTGTICIYTHANAHLIVDVTGHNGTP